MMAEAANLKGKLAQILELYDNDLADYAWAKRSCHNNGVASFRLLDDIPEQHWCVLYFFKNDFNINLTLNNT
jgi:hypothetical protein